MHSNDSKITSPLASPHTPVLSPAIPMETSTPYPSSSQHAQTAQLSPRERLSPIQQFFRKSATRIAKNSVKSRLKECKYNRSQPDYPDFQSVLRTKTRKGYKLWSPLKYCHIFTSFILHAPSPSTQKFCLIWLPITSNTMFFTADDPAYPLLANSAPAFLQIFTKNAAQPKLFFFVVQFRRRKPHSKLLGKTYKKAAEG